MTTKIANDPIYGEIRASICEAFIAAGKPTPERDWLYTRLVEAHAQLRITDGALDLAAELAQAIKPLLPKFDSVSGEEKEKWQRVVSVIFQSAEYAHKYFLADKKSPLQSSQGDGDAPEHAQSHGRGIEAGCTADENKWAGASPEAGPAGSDGSGRRSETSMTTLNDKSLPGLQDLMSVSIEKVLLARYSRVITEALQLFDLREMGAGDVVLVCDVLKEYMETGINQGPAALEAYDILEAIRKRIAAEMAKAATEHDCSK
jgi:hypothetical protein